MELAKIENLLEKYFEAETSIKEEAILKEYFSQDEVPEHLNQYKDLFGFFNESSHETSSRTIHLKKRTISIKWLSIAAMLVFFIGIYSVFRFIVEFFKEFQSLCFYALSFAISSK